MIINKKTLNTWLTESNMKKQRSAQLCPKAELCF